MKILHIVPSYKPAYIYGGPIISISQLCETLVVENIDVVVATTTANGKEELNVESNKYYQVAGVQVIYFSRWTKDHSHFSPSLLLYLWRYCKQYDVIHIHSWWNLISIFSVFICLAKGIRPILSPRGMLSSYSFNSIAKSLFHKSIGVYLLRRTLLHATANQEKIECQLLVPNWSAFVAPNIVTLPLPNLVEIKSDISINALGLKPLKLLFFSRIHHKKGLDLLFQALANINFLWTLTIAGDGEANEISVLKNLSDKLGISPNINWVGWVSKENKTDVLLQHDIMVLTSFNENFANVILESLSVGIPVLVSDKVGLSDYVAEKKLGWVCTLDTSNIMNALQDIENQKEFLPKMGQRAMEQVANDFNPSIIIKKYIDIYSNYPS